MSDLVVVGSGLFGLTVARRMAEEHGFRVTVVERRVHVGGNAYSERDPDTNIEVHRYGAHLFHTSNERVWAFVNRFTAFAPLRAPGLCESSGRGLPPPDQPGHHQSVLSGCLFLRPTRANRGVRRRPRSASVRRGNLEEKAIASVRPAALRGLHPRVTRRSSGRPTLGLLPAAVISSPSRPLHLRQPVFQRHARGAARRWIHARGSEAIADHPLIDVHLSTDFLDGAVRQVGHGGPGARRLHRPDRHSTSARVRRALLAHAGLRAGDRSRSATSRGRRWMNYVDPDVPFTRILEFKHFHPERTDVSRRDASVIVREFSRFAGDRRRAVLPREDRPADR